MLFARHCSGQSRCLILVPLLLGALFLPALAGGCGAALTSGSIETTPQAGSWVTTTNTVDLASSPPPTIRETGVTAPSTTLPSLPALGGGLTAEQVIQLVAARSDTYREDWDLRSCQNLGDWAVANLYTPRFSEQMDERGVTAVFQKRGGAWFPAGWVSVSDSQHQQMIELSNMGAPEEVWSYFGLEWKAPADLFPPERMPADFGSQPLKGGHS